MIVGSGTVAAVALSGYTAAAADDADGDGQTTLSSDLETVLELVPAESTLDTKYRRLHYVHVEEIDEDELEYETRQILDHVSAVDSAVDSESVSSAVSAVAGDGSVRLSAVTGSFDQPDAGDADEDGDWRIGTLDDGDAFAAADEQLVVVSGSESTDIAETVAESAQDDADSVLVSPEVTEHVFDRLESQAYVVFLPNLEDDLHIDFDGTVQSIGVGFAQSPTVRSGTTESEYVLELASDADVDDEWLLERLERIERGEFVETTVDRDHSNDIVHVEAVVDQPPERDRAAAPDARVRAHADADEGIVTIEHTDGESIETANLEVWMDGELADEQLDDDYEAFSEGDTFELETGPIADVGLRWFDEAEDVYYYYETVLVGRDSFELDYDVDTDTVEFTYVGELEADSDRLELIHQADNEASPPTREEIQLDSESLTTGETMTVDDVSLGDRITLELSTPANPNRGQRPLVRFRVRPPRVHLSQRPDSVVARYWDDHERDADTFRVLVDDEPGDVQFADVTETLTNGDEIDLGDVEHGASVVIEWLEPDDPIVIEESVIRPSTRIDLTYDDADGTVTVDHVDGDRIETDDLELRIDDEPADSQPADEYDTFKPGDEMTIDVEPFSRVELVWTVDDETEHRLGHTTAGRESFDATYDPDSGAVELVYTGEQPADPEPLSVEHRNDGQFDGDRRQALFAQEHDTLNTGDGIVIDDVGVDDRITVMLIQEGENYVSHRSIFNFTPEPRFAFTFDEREDGIVAIYRGQIDRDAAHFEVLSDGEPTAVQPSDQHDTLTADDEVELGAFDTGTELSVQWVVPDEPREIRNHVIVPDAEFEVEYRAAAEELTIEHAGGDEIDADELGVVVEPIHTEPMEWDDDETVTEGDTTTIDLEGSRDPGMVAIVFRERNTITYQRINN